MEEDMNLRLLTLYLSVSTVFSSIPYVLSWMQKIIIWFIDATIVPRKNQQ